MHQQPIKFGFGRPEKQKKGGRDTRRYSEKWIPVDFSITHLTTAGRYTSMRFDLCILNGQVEK